jgi:lactoylglutathione lyase
MKILWTALYVRNLDESVAFYADVAGLRVMRRFGAGPGLEIAFMGEGEEGETRVELLADASRASDRVGDAISLGFAAESLAALQERLRGMGIPLHAGPFETPTMIYVCVKDPNGLSVQFFQMK